MQESQNSAFLNGTQKCTVYQPGTRVRVTQQIAHRSHVYPIAITGTVIRQERQETGSWYARNKSQRLWLDRLIIEREDGEKMVLNLDEFTHIAVLDGDQPTAGSAPMVTANIDRAGSLT